MAASHDLIAPAVEEQINSFQWLTTAERYLALVDPGTHFTVGLRPDLATGQGYLQALSTAFFQVYLNNRAEYLPYLSAAYVERISQAEPRLYLLQLLPAQTARE